MTGESLYEDDDQELDEDYLDPHYLHSAAELYDNPELFYEMQGQLESAHGEGGMSDQLGYEVDLGRNYDQFDTDVDGDHPAMVGMSGAYRPIHQMPGYEEDEAVDQALSPRQYAMLINSMQDPLSMYASGLRSDDPNGYNEGRQSVQQGSAMMDQRVQEYNPLDMYSGTRGLYNTSPMYTDNEAAQVENFDGIDDYSDHPAFAIMNAGYNEQSNFDVGLGAGPRPPTRYGS